MKFLVGFLIKKHEGITKIIKLPIQKQIIYTVTDCRRRLPFKFWVNLLICVAFVPFNITVLNIRYQNV